jgi:hypothetical protein
MPMAQVETHPLNSKAAGFQKPAPIEHFYRFSCRARKAKSQKTVNSLS